MRCRRMNPPHLLDDVILRRQSDCLDGEDEQQDCDHPDSYGTTCNAKEDGDPAFFDKRKLCDDVEHCDAGQDEEGCEVLLSHNLTCNSFDDNTVLLNVTNKQHCEFPKMQFLEGYCESYIDQMNCTDSEVFYCTVRVGDKARGIQVGLACCN